VDEDREDTGELGFEIFDFSFLIMATYQKFEELKIWQEDRLLYKEIIALTKRGFSKRFPALQPNQSSRGVGDGQHCRGLRKGQPA
jgi:hypothetical protein